MMDKSLLHFAYGSARANSPHGLGLIPSPFPTFVEFKKLDTLNMVHACDDLGCAGNLSLTSAATTDALSDYQRGQRLDFFSEFSTGEPQIKILDVVFARRGNEALSKSRASRWFNDPGST